MAKAKFGTKIGLIAATVGSAVGLGNIWRFPAETQANGGAAFLFVYLLCLLVLGIPVMITEFALGRGGNGDAMTSFKNLKPGSKWYLAGIGSLLASYLILCFYMVVAGWTLEYLWQSITGNLYASDVTADGNLSIAFHHRINEYINSNFPPLYNIYALIIINIFILMGGVRKGIERMSNILMPILFLILIVLCGVSITLPGAADGLQFFLSPDFSKITPSVVVSALGQSFFSLSLGMGILITYSSYYPKETNLSKTAMTVSLLDLLVALLMGCIIFPAVSSFGLDQEQLSGTTLVFVTLPEIFAKMPGTQLWSILFFLLLLVAAVTSTVSIAEVTIAWIEDHYKKSRKVACLIVLCPLFIFSSLCSLSFGSLSFIKIAGMNIFDFLDNLATNIMLPLNSILICIFMGWVVSRKIYKDEITNCGRLKGGLFNMVSFLTRFVAPPLLLLILFASFLEF